MAYLGGTCSCFINVPDRFETRNGGLRKLEKYIRDVCGALYQATLQSLVEEYKWRKENRQNDNCQYHPPPTICLFGPASTVYTQPQLPPSASAMPPSVQWPGAEMNSHTTALQQLPWDSEVSSTALKARRTHRLRPEAPEYIPGQANSSRMKEAAEDGPSAHQRFGHDGDTTATSTSRNITVKEDPLAGKNPSSLIGDSNRPGPVSNAKMLPPPQLTCLTSASTAVSQKPRDGMKGNEANEVVKLETSTVLITVLEEAAPVKQDDPLAIQHFRDCRNWKLLLGSKPSSPSGGRHGAIGFGRLGPR